MGTFIFIAFVGWIADSEVDETGTLRSVRFGPGSSFI